MTELYEQASAASVEAEVPVEQQYYYKPKLPNNLPLWGNKQSMNLNTLLLDNIVGSPYYKTLSKLKTYHEVVDEIFYQVEHLEPWERGTRKSMGSQGARAMEVRGVGAGGVASTPYCLLYKLFTLKLSRKQLMGLLNHADSPFLRGLGFMYVRYCMAPDSFWTWFEPYLEDEEPIDPKAGGGDMMNIGQFVKLLMTKLDWYSTLFPRIPVPVEKTLRENLAQRMREKFQEGREKLRLELEEKEAQEKQRLDTLAASKNRDTRRSRSRSRGGGDYRSRGRDDHHRSKSRERDRRSRSRDKGRHRDRSREKKRSRDHDRHGSKEKHGHHKKHKKRRSRSRSR